MARCGATPDVKIIDLREKSDPARLRMFQYMSVLITDPFHGSAVKADCMLDLLFNPA